MKHLWWILTIIQIYQGHDGADANVPTIIILVCEIMMAVSLLAHKTRRLQIVFFHSLTEHSDQLAPHSAKGSTLVSHLLPLQNKLREKKRNQTVTWSLYLCRAQLHHHNSTHLFEHQGHRDPTALVMDQALLLKKILQLCVLQQMVGQTMEKNRRKILLILKNYWAYTNEMTNRLDKITILLVLLDTRRSNRRIFIKEVCLISTTSMVPSPIWQKGEKPFGALAQAHEIFKPFTIKKRPLTVFQSVKIQKKV